MTQLRGRPDILPGFRWDDIEANGVRIRAAIGGAGPPVLLLHGYPQTHLTWHRLAPALARDFTVVATDLRGYGDSEKPDGGEDHVNYAKRTMAADQVSVMRHLGHERFAVVGHDRGGRVAHRMALDHASRITRLAVLDIAPTATMYARTDKVFATEYFWWFFLIQPFDLPERMIGADPDFFFDRLISAMFKVEGAADPRVVDDYRRCFRDPAMRHASCEDYRAAAGLDLRHDAADADRRIEAPLLALWGARGTVGRLYDVLATWREKAVDVTGCAIDCGHTPQEERPDEVLERLRVFLAST